MVGVAVSRVFRLHLAVIAAFVVAHAVVMGASLLSGRPYLAGLVPLFDLNREGGPGNFFSAAALLAAAGAAWLLWRAEPDRRTARGWGVAALVLAFLAFDEGAGLHDRIGPPLQAALGTSGALYIAWVVPYAALVALVGAVCLPLLRALPRATLLPLVAAGALYVSAAIGMELVQGVVLSEAAEGRTLAGLVADGEALGEANRHPVVVATVAVEEGGEMLAVALALRALLLHLVAFVGVRSVGLSVRGDRGPVGSAGAGPLAPLLPATLGRHGGMRGGVAAE